MSNKWSLKIAPTKHHRLKSKWLNNVYLYRLRIIDDLFSHRVPMGFIYLSYTNEVSTFFLLMTIFDYNLMILSGSIFIFLYRKQRINTRTDLFNLYYIVHDGAVFNYYRLHRVLISNVPNITKTEFLFHFFLFISKQ